MVGKMPEAPAPSNAPIAEPEGKRLKIVLVAAMGEGNRVIGKNGALPWHLPEDLALFKRTTLGKTVVMGSNTYLSLPEKFRPLPDRRNVVITSRPASELEPDPEKRARFETFPSPESAFSALAAEGAGEAFVIGGSRLYGHCVDSGLADEIRLSVVPGNHDGDVRFPEFEDRYSEVSSEGMGTFRLSVYRKNDHHADS